MEIEQATIDKEDNLLELYCYPSWYNFKRKLSEALKKERDETAETLKLIKNKGEKI